MPEDKMSDGRFRLGYRELEARMRALAEADRDAFLPNPEPPGPVDYVFICMEPSLGRWARSADEAKTKVEAGARNFVSSIEDFILHFCIREYLCGSGRRYHVTDLAKGAMLVDRADDERTRRYDRWYPLLQDEIHLLAPSGEEGIFAVGRVVAEHLRGRSFPTPFTTLIHYSGQAARARAEGIRGHEAAFHRFEGSVTREQVLGTAADVLKESVPDALRDETLGRLAAGRLSSSQRQLIFNYKLAFEATLARKRRERWATRTVDSAGRARPRCPAPAAPGS